MFHACSSGEVEGTVLKEQVKYSTYYEMTLEQHWEQIFASENMNNEGNTVAVDAAAECGGNLRFALKRMDGSLLLTYDFRYTHRIRSKWES
uniref:Uncharacterized protein n=1 Tax=Salix viminalis TaxID=40686 RepID=A0A6N2LUR0_SALVM